MQGNFVKNRRGILQHLKEGRISKDEFAAYEFMLLSADAATGVWWGDSVELTAAFGQRDLRQEKAKDVLHGLEEKGYIKRFRQQGSRAKYPILINKYEITVGPLSDRLVDAGSTVDWRQPAVFTSCDETPVTPPVETPVRPPVVPPPYSRTQDNENSRPQDKATRPSESTSPPASDDSPGETRNTYSKLEDVPRDDQSRILTSRIFIDLGSPKDKAKQLPDWKRELDPLCDQYEFPLLCEAVRWAITESPHWPQYIRRAANVARNAEPIVDAYRAELRSRATYERAKKQQAEKAAVPKNDNRPEYKKDTTQFL
jgi:hypothetical protein